jgi:hypothetical protein
MSAAVGHPIPGIAKGALTGQSRASCHLLRRTGTGRPYFEKAIGEEQADGLSLLIVVGACGALVAVLRNHAEIVLARVKSSVFDPQSIRRPQPLLQL